MPRRRPPGRARALLAAAVSIAGLVLAAGCGQPDTPPDTPPVPPPAVTSEPTSDCEFKPTADNTGASGTLQDSSTQVLQDGETLENVRLDGLEIQGTSVVVRNVEVTGAILVLGDDVLLDRVTAASVAISSASRVTVQHTRIGDSQEDGINVTSDRGRMAKNILLTHNYVATPNVDDEAHYDGTQVRGVDQLRIHCSTYDAGPYQPMYNAAIYLENANGGNKRVSLEHNWLYGSGFSLMIGTGDARIIGNRIGGDIHWGTCALGSRIDVATLEVRDNYNENSKEPERVCLDSGIRLN
jgi:hypothetical protein